MTLLFFWTCFRTFKVQALRFVSPRASARCSSHTEWIRNAADPPKRHGVNPRSQFVVTAAPTFKQQFEDHTAQTSTSTTRSQSSSEGLFDPNGFGLVAEC